jgi:hypothetical protein
MNVTLDLAVSALLIWCQHLLKSDTLSAQQQSQLERLLRDIDRIARKPPR